MELTHNELIDYLSMLYLKIETENTIEKHVPSAYKDKLEHINTFIKIYNGLFK